jgi:hypothetical protein
MSVRRTIESPEGEIMWEASGNSFEVAAEHAAEQATTEGGVEAEEELEIHKTRIVVGRGSHISDYIVILKRPSS